jgi:hypothetical protein
VVHEPLAHGLLDLVADPAAEEGVRVQLACDRLAVQVDEGRQLARRALNRAGGRCG